MKDIYFKAAQFKALSDETRLKILSLIGKNEICACKILENLNITQPTLSYHMKILSDTQIIRVRKEGIWMHYSLSPETINELEIFLENILKSELS